MDAAACVIYGALGSRLPANSFFGRAKRLVILLASRLNLIPGVLVSVYSPLGSSDGNGNPLRPHELLLDINWVPITSQPHQLLLERDSSGGNRSLEIRGTFARGNYVTTRQRCILSVGMRAVGLQILHLAVHLGGSI